MAIYSSILAWRILWTEEPGWLQSIGSQKSETTEQLTLSHFHYADSQSGDMLFAGCLLFLCNFLLPYSSKSMLNPVSLLVSEGMMLSNRTLLNGVCPFKCWPCPVQQP